VAASLLVWTNFIYSCTLNDAIVHSILDLVMAYFWAMTGIRSSTSRGSTNFCLGIEAMRSKNEPQTQGTTQLTKGNTVGPSEAAESCKGGHSNVLVERLEQLDVALRKKGIAVQSHY
jgi:hypothetical protein